MSLSLSLSPRILFFQGLKILIRIMTRLDKRVLTFSNEMSGHYIPLWMTEKHQPPKSACIGLRAPGAMAATANITFVMTKEQVKRVALYGEFTITLASELLRHNTNISWLSHATGSLRPLSRLENIFIRSPVIPLYVSCGN